MTQIKNIQSEQNELVTVGLITNVHGVKGLLKIKSFTENALDIFDFEPLFIGKDKQVQLEKCGVQKDVFITKMQGINDRTTAETYKGVELYVYRNQLPELQGDEFYHSDIIGIDVVTVSGEPFGTVKDIVNYGAGDLVEIQLMTTKKTELFSLENDITDLDLENGKAVLQIPTYLEADSNES